MGGLGQGGTDLRREVPEAPAVPAEPFAAAGCRVAGRNLAAAGAPLRPHLDLHALQPPTPRAFGPHGPTRPSASGTPEGTGDVSSAS